MRNALPWFRDRLQTQPDFYSARDLLYPSLLSHEMIAAWREWYIMMVMIRQRRFIWATSGREQSHGAPRPGWRIEPSWCARPADEALAVAAAALCAHGAPGCSVVATAWNAAFREKAAPKAWTRLCSRLCICRPALTLTWPSTSPVVQKHRSCGRCRLHRRVAATRCCLSHLRRPGHLRRRHRRQRRWQRRKPQRDRRDPSHVHLRCSHRVAAQHV